MVYLQNSGISSRNNARIMRARQRAREIFAEHGARAGGRAGSRGELCAEAGRMARRFFGGGCPCSVQDCRRAEGTTMGGSLRHLHMGFPSASTTGMWWLLTRFHIHHRNWWLLTRFRIHHRSVVAPYARSPGPRSTSMRKGRPLRRALRVRSMTCRTNSSGTSTSECLGNNVIRPRQPSGRPTSR